MIAFAYRSPKSHPRPYADVVLGMLVNEHATAEDIAHYLFKIATEHMALTDRGMAELCDRAAKAIVALRSDF
ncbi:hypothetical protein [Rhizobium giardinii]|uniref:hypothetical protein n=1 Tax=Rhizobium giardinii TaxID=56731 RepID=UPI003D6E840E